ncbi:hypothetical protein [Arthrobacter cavernae]|uniref:YfhO family protein n=1 Tax=Arthrobacter cavernae TaxID=2817681 RepID=A0A939HEF4_9MICC|nr:hypothetical protein [Arthrobacter cavernae]MBO1266853.1 hypothetical protein [Arthrobacter cavernae]
MVTENPLSKATLRSRLKHLLPPLSMLAMVAVGVILPLRGSAGFYVWDDTAAAAVGVWQRIGQQYVHGSIPFLQIDMWRGGNFAAEAATGMFNPVMAGLMVATYFINDVAAAITLAKFAMFAIMALGIYLLTRSYGAKPWISALAGLTLPLSGYTLYMDGAAWINGLIITSLTPWVWWACKRYIDGRGSIVWTVVAGFVLGSTGNPYGMVALAATFAAVSIEVAFRRHYVVVAKLIAAMFAAALACVMVYLPFFLTVGVGFRADSTTMNNEFFSPSLSAFLGMSTPSFQPFIQTFAGSWFTFPVMYLAWFILPLLPWLRWKESLVHWKALTGIFAFGLFYLLLILGPSNLWMFRLPLRLLPFVYLPVLVLFAIVASRGWQQDRRRIRTAVSFALVFVGAWQSFSDLPAILSLHAASLAIVVILVAGLLLFRWEGPRLFAYTAVASLVVLFMQTTWMPVNNTVASYSFPHNRSQMVDTFTSRYKGNTVFLVDRSLIPVEQQNRNGIWKDALIGNMPSVAGLESTTAYSGVGFNKFDTASCSFYYGGACPEGWRLLWANPDGSKISLADLVRAETVVRRNDPLPASAGDAAGVTSPEAPPGWTKASTNENVTVYTRDEALPYPDGRISYQGAQLRVSQDHSISDYAESAVVTNDSGAPQDLVFARLAWPGYSATLDGRPLPTSIGPAGLLQVQIPANTTDGELEVSFKVPGTLASSIAFGTGVLITVALVVLERRRGIPGALRKTRAAKAVEPTKQEA